MVYGILQENDLSRFYQLDPDAARTADELEAGTYDFLADAAVKRRMIDFSDGRISRVTFSLPNIHCVACVWLLERIYKLQEGIGQPEVNFTRKTVMIPFEEEKITLVELAGLLARIGYPPEFKLQQLQHQESDGGRRRAWMQLGVAGFAFGNIMLLAFPGYLGLNPREMPWLPGFFGVLSLLLSLPVLFYSAQDYFRSAWLGLKHKEISIDVPIALGILALFFQSLSDIVRGVGEGYLDSLAGLVFFLLIGKAFQRRSFDALSFDREYAHYFPLAALKINEDGSQSSLSLDRIQCGDRLRIRNGELIPADAVLMEGPALIDYSFVTGESRPESRLVGETLFAGGRHHGAPIDVEVIKEVSQSYLTSLWNHQSFRKENERRFDRMTQEVARIFTLFVLIIAALTGVVWMFIDPSQALRCVSAVLIVACPCALALSAPFAFGSALRILRPHGLYLKNGFVVEGISRVRHLAFDKTGTLTHGGLGSLRWEGRELSPALQEELQQMCAASTHPLSRAIAQELPQGKAQQLQWQEHTGKGLEAWVQERHVRLGSRNWLMDQGLHPIQKTHVAAECWLALDQEVLGRFVFEDAPRKGLHLALPQLGKRYDLSVLTGDRKEGIERLKEWFPGCADTRSELSPAGKLEAIDQLRRDGRSVMMLGDGLNDAGALKHSDVGVAVSEDIQAFSPACDAILEANRISALPKFLRFARMSRNVVLLCFAVSIVYNLVGISIAASGQLSPLFAAILMPLSSVSVLLLSVSGTRLAAQFVGLGQQEAQA